MSDITEALREEHQALLPQIDELRAFADRLDEMPRHDVRHDLDGVYQFLTQHLIPHAAAEEDTLYPAVAKILGSPQATATMSRDHVEVSRLTEQLGVAALSSNDLRPRANEEFAPSLVRSPYAAQSSFRQGRRDLLAVVGEPFE